MINDLFDLPQVYGFVHFDYSGIFRGNSRYINDSAFANEPELSTIAAAELAGHQQAVAGRN
jgi:hypothetical protein